MMPGLFDPRLFDPRIFDIGAMAVVQTVHDVVRLDTQLFQAAHLNGAVTQNVRETLAVRQRVALVLPLITGEA